MIRVCFVLLDLIIVLCKAESMQQLADAEKEASLFPAMKFTLVLSAAALMLTGNLLSYFNSLK